MILWITGLSGSGKTTLAREVCQRLEGARRTVILLDGDELRSIFNNALADEISLTREGRLELALKYGRLCMMLGKQGLDIVIATISLFKEVHAWNLENLENYYQVYLNVPHAELRERDPKGIYRRFDDGEITNVAGLDIEIDAPRSPDWAPVYDPQKSASALAEELIEKLIERNLV